SGSPGSSPRSMLRSTGIALLCQFLSARSIVEVATRPLKKSDRTGEIGHRRSWQGEASRDISARNRECGGLAAISGGLVPALADRDLVWRRTERVMGLSPGSALA